MTRIARINTDLIALDLNQVVVGVFAETPLARSDQLRFRSVQIFPIRVIRVLFRGLTSNGERRKFLARFSKFRRVDVNQVRYLDQADVPRKGPHFSI